MMFQNTGAFRLLLIIPVMLGVNVLFGLLRARDITRFAESDMFNRIGMTERRVKRIVKAALFYAAIVCIIIAMARPRFGMKTEIVKRMGIDAVIALDTSFSMLAEDIKPNRIKNAKYEIGRLIDNLQGDRIALVAYAGKSFVQCPLTSDYGAAKTLLDNIGVGIIPQPGTNIGDAIDRSIELLQRGSGIGSESQAILLFSDGEDLGGNLESSIRRAQNQQIRIFTVGVGTPGGELIPIRNENGTVEGYKKDSKGELVQTRLDVESLRRIAHDTGGVYIETKNGEIDIDTILDMFGTMHRADFQEVKVTRLKERYQIPLAAGILLLCAWVILDERRTPVDYQRMRSAV